VLRTKVKKYDVREMVIFITITVIVSLKIVVFYNSQNRLPDGTKIKLSGKLTSEPIQYDTSQGVFFLGYKFYLPLQPKLSYGDEIVVVGVTEKDKLKSPQLVQNISGRMVYQFRNKILGFYNRSLPKDHAALVAGVVLGAKSGIGYDLWEKFKSSGTAHVVVASGMNVTLVAGFLLNFLLLFIKRQYAIVFAIIGVWLYAVLSGFEAPIVRACVMGSIAFTAQELGKRNFAYRSLFLTGFVMLFINPSWFFDLGFWLSFLATLAILKFEKPIEYRLRKIPVKAFRQDLSTTLAAQIGVFPILYYFFGQFNIFSPLINAVVLWTIVPITLIGMISGLISLVYEPIGTLILYLSYPLTSWFLTVVNLV